MMNLKSPFLNGVGVSRLSCPSFYLVLTYCPDSSGHLRIKFVCSLFSRSGACPNRSEYGGEKLMHLVVVTVNPRMLMATVSEWTSVNGIRYGSCLRDAKDLLSRISKHRFQISKKGRTRHHLETLLTHKLPIHWALLYFDNRSPKSVWANHYWWTKG